VRNTEDRSSLARRLVETRVVLADAVVERVAPRSSGQASPPIVRSLISALGQGLEAGSPAPVVSWARLARRAYTLPVIQDLVASSCEIAAEMGQGLDYDFSALLVFLEIVRTSVVEAFPLARKLVVEDPSRTAGSVIEGVLAMLKARDHATCAHSHATGAWCRRLSEALGLSQASSDFIFTAGVLHDIGKIATPDEILFKPGPLTDAEWIVMQKHAEFGSEILAELPTLAKYAPIVRAHHERWDGLGYPDGLAGEEIPFEARVVAVADAFHAMISDRPYRPAIAQREAIEILREGRGTQWDGKVVDAMIAMLQAPRKIGKREVAHG
jgi:putative nucleotidyltransferase with HDIG domain